MSSAYQAALPLPLPLRARFEAWLCGVLGCIVLAACAAAALTLLTWTAVDVSLNNSSSVPPRNFLGPLGAILADLVIRLFGLAGVFLVLPPVFWGLQLVTRGGLAQARVKIVLAPVSAVLLACSAAALPRPASWVLPHGLGGLIGDQTMNVVAGFLSLMRPERASAAAGLFCLAGGLLALSRSLGLSRADLKLIFRVSQRSAFRRVLQRWLHLARDDRRPLRLRREPTLRMPVSNALRPKAAAAVPHPSRSDSAFDSSQFKPHLELAPDETSKIARRFAPVHRDPNSKEARLHLSDDDQWAEAWPREAAREGTVQTIEPMPVPSSGEPAMHLRGQPWRPYAQPRRDDPAFDDLYGRAVAIVLRDRKASKEYLQQRLAIGYMRASDLVERMECEGVLGAPVCNGVRPILLDGRGSDEV